MSTPEAFEQVRAGVARLLADLPRVPAALRVEAQDVVIELAWDLAASRAQPAVNDAEPGDRQSPPALPGPRLHHVTAPTVGVFYGSPEPGAPPFVEVGTVVAPGDQVAIVEAMKLFLPVESVSRGRVAAVLVQDGDSVEYGEPLIALEPVES